MTGHYFRGIPLLVAFALLGQEKEAPTTFALRVSPEWAKLVNQVLQRVAHPKEVALPEGMTANNLVDRLCAGHAVDSPVENEPGKILFSACVQIAKDVKVTIRPGNTLEGIAVRNGLQASDGASLKVTRPDTGEIEAPGVYKAGDVVNIPEVPVWTTVAVRHELIKDRKSLVDAIAEAVKCKGDKDDCLIKRGIFILEGAGAKHETQPAPDKSEHHVELMRDALAGVGRLPSVDDLVDAEALLPISPAPTRPPPTLPTPKPLVPVAKDQWPYDVKTLAAIYENLHPPLPTGGIVGVADFGLADAKGGPLPDELFDHSQDQRPDYFQDVIGAGVKRNEFDPAATGDVGLCGGIVQPPFVQWAPNPFGFASHGSVTGSLAGALPVRQGYSAIAPMLPHIVFFRMLASACDPGSSFDPGEAALGIAFTYLAQRADVISISFMSTSSPLTNFVNLVQPDLDRNEQILVLASGDDSPGDLDQNPTPPQLLGSNVNDVYAANRTIVVGSATRELIKSLYSNYGDGTVTLYAPGEAIGARDVAGKDASLFSPATSYSAPRVALAAGILKSFGYPNARAIKDRLAAATWPLGGERAPRIGVVDLVKVAAVQHYAVEVIEPGTDGVLVRRTYVGTMQEPLQDLRICQGLPFFEERVHAVRLDGEGPDRSIRAYLKNDFEATGGPLSGRRRIEAHSGCRPQGQVHITDLVTGQTKTFSLTSVTEIQIPWLPKK